MKTGIGLRGGAVVAALMGLAFPVSAALAKTTYKSMPKPAVTPTVTKPVKTVNSASNHHALSMSKASTTKTHAHSPSSKKSKKSHTHKTSNGASHHSSLFSKNQNTK